MARAKACSEFAPADVFGCCSELIHCRNVQKKKGDTHAGCTLDLSALLCLYVWTLHWQTALWITKNPALTASDDPQHEAWVSLTLK